MLHFSVSDRHTLVRAAAISAVCSLLLILGACATAPPPPNSNPIDNQSCAIGLNLKMRIPAKFLSVKPDVVVFARVEEGGALTESFELYGSTYAHDGYAYLMNAEPGTYVVAGAIYERVHEFENSTKREIFHNYFSCELIEQTRMTVTPGSFAFIGRIVGDQSMLFGDADDCQRHVQALVEGEGQSGLSRFVGAARSIRLSFHEKDVDRPAKEEFLKKSREFFATTEWTALIDTELSKLN